MANSMAVLMTHQDEYDVTTFALIASNAPDYPIVITVPDQFMADGKNSMGLGNKAYKMIGTFIDSLYDGEITDPLIMEEISEILGKLGNNEEDQT